MTRTIAALLLTLAWRATAQAAGWPALTKPAQQSGGEKDAALVVGIEQYAAVASVPGAAQNAKDWFTWLRSARGVPLSNVTLLVDSEGMLEKIRIYAEEAAAKVKPGGTLWFVFIGHGAPAKDGREGLLVGYDAQQDPIGLYARSLPHAELRMLLLKSKATRVVMVLDACFSGKTGSGAMIAEGLQPLIAVNRDVEAMAKMVVLTAGKGDQFAGPLPGEKRPAFSYLLLGALRGWGDRNGDGKVTAEEAVEYANEALTATVKGRRQTPELEAKDPKVVLAAEAKEQGPDLDEMVLQAAMGPRAPRADEEVAPSASRTTGGVHRELNLEAERLHDAANRVQADAAAPSSLKAESWCALAELQEENPYRQKAASACQKWRALAAAKAQKQWLPIVDAAGGFRFELPAAPQVQSMPTQPGVEAATSYVLDQGDFAFAVATAPLPGLSEGNDSRMIVDKAANGAAAQSGGTVEALEDATFAGAPARHLRYTIPGGRAESYLAIRDGALFVAGVVYVGKARAEDPREAQARRFFESFSFDAGAVPAP